MSKYVIRSKAEKSASDDLWKPHAYQELGMEFLLTNQGAGLFLDPGLGKTSITLGAISLLKEAGQIKRVLIVAPLRVCHLVWPEEVKKWAQFRHLRVVVLHGKEKENLLKVDADIYVINPDGLGWLLQKGKKRLEKLNADVLCIDESTLFKHTTTQRFKLLKPVLPKFKRRWILTGTPAPNGLLDLFGQCYIMDLGASLGAFITAYRQTYFQPAGTATVKIRGEMRQIATGYVPLPGAADIIYERLSKKVLRLAAKDYLTLPEMVETNIMVELPPSARNVYKELEEKLVADVAGGLVTAANAATASMKCRQVAAGGIYVTHETEDFGPSQRETVHLHDVKTDALLELIDSLQGSPLLVAYEFQHDLQRLLRALGENTPYIGGGTTAKRSKELADLWNTGRIPVMLGHPQSMGHGLNLQAAGNHVAWYTPTWNYELYDQFNRRVLRQGNKNSHVFVYRFVAKDTVDTAVVGALRRKEREQGVLLDALKDYTRQRK